ncbi:NAD(P)/FAD-dependent oxidoreductase [Actinomadura sp. GC306]|uniref:flavin-containing monooxygenase n=1 Tax=Actinomadura sp. GC306 TaxID=2530367 RepID=UPI001043B9FC|nr:NAD(P)/FAD-dependent oxidoreductase [Actinomadura sp. GC306]TDC65929.1 NAD(P)/FAD-dependent oxidoreductase [Actinomadura sp. GC306]
MTQTSPPPRQDAEGSREVDAVVVGAGLSGLYMLYKLRGLGLSVQVYEKGGDVGGTWFWNRYPGARVDVKSLDYAYSFDSALEQEWEWTEKYPAQEELLRYIRHVADRFGLRPHIRLRTAVTGAAFDEGTGRWDVRTDGGDRVSAQYLIMATGCLSTPRLPDVPGLESFRGDWYHTANWPEEGADFTGKRVAVVGTASSGVQIIPVIAEQAAELTVFQRTPNFVIPANNHPLDPETQRAVKARYAEVRKANRESGFGVAFPEATKGAMEVPDEARDAYYRKVWYDKDNSLVSLLSGYNDLIISKESNDTIAQFVRDRIAEVVNDPEIAAELQPTDHPLGAKRPCLGTNYYETFNLAHVRLVNARKTPLVEITPTGLRTSEEEFAFDAVVFATGFDAITGALTAVDIRGRGGVRLSEKWAEGPRTYLGLAVAGFPNLFTITGPGSPSVLSNMMVSIEQHVEWVGDAIAAVRSRGERTIEATAEAEDAWTQHVAEVAQATLYPAAESWYLGANVPGKPRVFLPYPAGVGVYRQTCDEVAAAGYRGFRLAG